MNKFSKLFNYFLSLVIVFLFLLVFVTENTNIVNNNFKKILISKIERSLDIKLQIDKISINWFGLTPVINFYDIKALNKTNNNRIVHGKKLEISLDTMNSIKNIALIPKELNLVETDINLTYTTGKILFQGKDILKFDNLEKNKRSVNELSNLQFRISNSKITINDLNQNDTHYLNNINLVLIRKNPTIKIFTTFNYNDSHELIQLAADLKSNDNTISGQIYSKGNELNLNKTTLLPNKNFLSALQLNYEIWISLRENQIHSMKGNITSKNLTLSNELKNNTFKNIMTNFNYMKKKNISLLELSDLRFDSKHNKYLDNYLYLKVHNKSKISILVKEISIPDLKDLIIAKSVRQEYRIKKLLKNVNSGKINNLNIYQLNKPSKSQISFIFSDLNFNKTEEFVNFKNISGRFVGSLKKGNLKINNGKTKISIKENQHHINIKNIKGSVNYQIKGNILYFNTNNLKINDYHNVLINGNVKKDKLNYRVRSNGSIKSLKDIIVTKSDTFDLTQDLKVFGDYKIDIRSENNNIFGAINLKNMILENPSNNIVINKLNTRINFSNGYLISNKSQFFLNKSKFNFQINTDILNNKPKYFIQTSGELHSKLIGEYTKLDYKKYIKGKVQAKIILYYEPKNIDKKVHVTLRSDLDGMDINTIRPFYKKSNEKKLFQISYIVNPKKKYKMKVIFDKYKMLLDKKDSNWLINVNSPYIQGNVLWPLKITSNNRIRAKLKYFDADQFGFKSQPDDIPYMHFIAQQTKISGVLLDNVSVTFTPSKNNLKIENFKFSNAYLSMNANGKWSIENGKEKTFFTAGFKSDDFGRALKGLGHDGLIKKGILNAQLKGEWNGSPEMFEFSKLNGDIIIKVKEGEVLQVQKQTKAIGQVLGLFSISSLPKRLNLDFSDLFSKGLEFDSLDAEMDFGNGLANTKKMIIVGGFGEMRLTGETNLKNRTYDQVLLYIPDLSSTSLITGAAIGGPVGAVASIFYDQLLKEFGIDTNKLAAIEYSLTGPWDNPDIKVTQSFKPILN